MTSVKEQHTQREQLIMMRLTKKMKWCVVCLRMLKNLIQDNFYPFMVKMWDLF